MVEIPKKENLEGRDEGMANQKQYISLKEAAKMSGYSPDYVGQLIRAGKITGKQILSNVAWVTTEDAILEYIQKEKGGKVTAGPAPHKIADIIFSPEGLARTYAIVAWVAIGFFGLFIVFLISVFAISIDHSIDQKYIQEAANESSQ
jgi:hypothetical protein